MAKEHRLKSWLNFCKTRMKSSSLIKTLSQRRTNQSKSVTGLIYHRSNPQSSRQSQIHSLITPKGTTTLRTKSPLMNMTWLCSRLNEIRRSCRFRYLKWRRRQPDSSSKRCKGLAQGNLGCLGDRGLKSSNMSRLTIKVGTRMACKWAKRAIETLSSSRKTQKLRK